MSRKGYKKTERRNGVVRFMFTMLAILLQIGWIEVGFIVLNDYYSWIALATKVVSIALVLYLSGKRINYSVKLPWIVLILLFPLFGILLYAFYTISDKTNKKRKCYSLIDKTITSYLPDSKKNIDRLERKEQGVANFFRYITDNASYPVYTNTDVKFFPEASLCYDAQIEDLKKAKNFIFIEYFSVEDSVSFKRMKDILVEKVKSGVDVRLLYDDVGSMKFVDLEFVKEMREMGIKCYCFNPMIPFFQVFLNHRDHRKICVIDGKTAYTGGYNLADEYFNVTSPFGYWKDSGIRITGEAVRSLTMIFLETWNAVLSKQKIEQEDCSLYLPAVRHFSAEEGYVLPFADSPLDSLHTGEDVYLNMINYAQKYIYISTPYLLIMDELRKALILAAGRGVDVRIITPGIPDKKFTYMCTRSYYHDLVKHGVRIFEYTPGFIHSKQAVLDDKIAFCGTVNFDYRSFYHHFENGVVMYNMKAVTDIKKDFDETLPQCTEVSEKYKGHMNTFVRIISGMLKLFTPLM